MGLQRVTKTFNFTLEHAAADRKMDAQDPMTANCSTRGIQKNRFRRYGGAIPRPCNHQHEAIEAPPGSHRPYTRLIGLALMHLGHPADSETDRFYGSSGHAAFFQRFFAFYPIKVRHQGA